jgi:hypothetical protein
MAENPRKRDFSNTTDRISDVASLPKRVCLGGNVENVLKATQIF